MTAKAHILALILGIGLFVGFQARAEEQAPGKGILLRLEAEKADASGDYTIRKDKRDRYLQVPDQGRLDLTLKGSVSGDSVLWMRSRSSGTKKILFQNNQKKINLKASYAFQWQKIGTYTDFTQTVIHIHNPGQVIDLDCFYLAEPGVLPFSGKQVVDDLLADLDPDRAVRISFSGLDVRGAEVTLFRKLTTAAYKQYLQDRYGQLSYFKWLLYLIRFFDRPHQKVAVKKITSSHDYRLLDKEPLAGYECGYYLQIKNGFGQSLRSVKLYVEYDEANGKISQRKVSRPLKESYAYERRQSSIKLQAGYLRNSREKARLYLNSSRRMKNLPSFLQGSQYFAGLRQGENVVFVTGKSTDVYVYTPEFDALKHQYYRDKGFSLVQVPLSLTGSKKKRQAGHSYFYHKQYRKGQSDSLYLREGALEKPGPKDHFSLCVEDDDLLVYYESKGSRLEEAVQIYVRGIDVKSGRLLFKKRMRQLKDGVWEYVLAGGSERYQAQGLRFEFVDDAGVWEANQQWQWGYYDYLSAREPSKPGVVFFKESTARNIDINFSRSDHSLDQGLEGYYPDRGQVFGKQGNGLSYGFTEEQNVQNRRLFGREGVSGVREGQFLEISYRSRGRVLADSDFIDLVYCFNEQTTEQELRLESIGPQQWQGRVFIEAGQSGIDFYFKNSEQIDDNQQANWSWAFVQEPIYAGGYEEDLAKRSYVELAGGSDTAWQLKTENGIYQFTLLLEKALADVDAYLTVNGRCYRLSEKESGLVEVSGRLIIVDETISLLNSGHNGLKLYAFKLLQDKKKISRSLLPITFEAGHEGEIYTDLYEWHANGPERLRAEFDLAGIELDHLELLFEAGSDQGGELEISLSSDFEAASLLARVALAADSRIFHINLSDYGELIQANGGQLVLYLRSLAPGKIRLMTHRNENASFHLQSSFLVEQGEAYQGIGVLSESGSGYQFTASSDGKIYEAYSEQVDLEQFKDMAVMVSGYVLDEILFIVQVEPIIYVKQIIGDTYTNAETLTWQVLCNRPIDGLSYRIRGAVEQWVVVPGSLIYQHVAEDGEYVLEVRPQYQGMSGSAAGFNFIVDRSGPTIEVTESLPEYTSEQEHRVGIVLHDQYSSQSELKAFYQVKDASDDTVLKAETELNLVEGQADLVLPEGRLKLELYGRDSLGNKGPVFDKELIVDLTAPSLQGAIQYYYTRPEQNRQQYAVLDLTRDDNLSSEAEIVTYYSLDQASWQSTTEDRISLDFADFEADGEYQLFAYCRDKGGLESEQISQKFIIDRVPLAMGNAYQAEIKDNRLLLTWDEHEGEASFSHYRIKRTPDFSLDFEGDARGGQDVVLNAADNSFLDVDSFYDPSFTYAVKVIDIYGNVSEALTCFAFNSQAVSGQPGELKSLGFSDYGSVLKFKLTENSPSAIGMIRRDQSHDQNVAGEYGFIPGQAFELGPKGTVFQEGLTWELDLSDLSDLDVEQKEQLTLYHYNESDHSYESVESVYDAVNDRLLARLYHFSTYALGEKRDNGLDLARDLTSVSAVDGSVEAVAPLFDLPGHKGSYPVRLNFNSAAFNRMSNFVFADPKLYFMAELDMKPVLPSGHDKNLANNLPDGQSLTFGTWSAYALAYWGRHHNMNVYKKMLFSSKFLDYEELKQPVNHLDNAWQFNLPKLSGDQKSGHYKFIRFDDGSRYELKPRDNVYSNRIGKKFIYRKLEHHYLVELEGYKNYLFNAAGEALAIFYSNRAGEIYKQLDLTADQVHPAVLYSFHYDSDRILEQIKSYTRQGDIDSQVLFAYEKVKEAKNPRESHYIKRLSKVSRQKYTGTEYVTLSTVKPVYQTIQTLKGKSECYLYVESQAKESKGEAMAIEYQRLVRLDYAYFRAGQSSAYETESKEFVYELGRETALINSSDIKGIMGQKSIDLAFPYTNLGFNAVGQNKAPEKQAFNITNLYVTNAKSFEAGGEKYQPGEKYKRSNLPEVDVKIKQLERLLIKERDQDYTFVFDYYVRANHWNLLARQSLGICREKKTVYKSRQGEAVNQEQPFVNYYLYRKNEQAELPAFSRSVTLTPYSAYGLSSGGSVSVESLSRLYFAESVLDRYYGPLDTRRGIMQADYDGDLFAGYEKKTAGKELEELGQMLSYSHKKVLVAGDNRLYGEDNWVNYEQGGEKIQSQNRLEYSQDELGLIKAKHYSYNRVDQKSVYYDYYRGEGVDADELFLNANLAKTVTSFDEERQSIEENEFESNAGSGVRRIVRTRAYLSGEEEQAQEKEYEYDVYDNRIKEVKVSESSADSQGLKGRTMLYEYNACNNPTRIKIKGTTQVTGSSGLEPGTASLVSDFYYSTYDQNLLADCTYSEAGGEGQTVRLYFYDQDGWQYKSVTLYYQETDAGLSADGLADVKLNYSREKAGSSLLGSGHYLRQEASASYAAYFEQLKNSEPVLDVLQAAYEAYQSEMSELRKAGFAFDQNPIDFIYASHIAHYGSLILEQSEYKRDLEDESIHKRFIRQKVQSDHLVLEKTTDTGLAFTWQYDGLGNMKRQAVKNLSGGQVEPAPLTYSYRYGDYFNEVTQKRSAMSYLSRYNSFGSLIYQKTESDDQSLSYEESFAYNQAHLLTDQSGIGGIRSEYEYNLLGLTGSRVFNRSGSKQLRTGQILRKQQGRETYGYSHLRLNSAADLDQTWLENNWQERSLRDHFGNAIESEVKYDRQILADGIDPAENILSQTAYNAFGQPIRQSSNLYDGTVYDALEEINLAYTQRQQLESKEYSSWDPAAGQLVGYREEYDYDSYQRLAEVRLLKEGIIESRSLIADYDHNQKVTLSYVKARGENWRKIKQSYNIDGLLVYRETSVLDVSTASASLSVLGSAGVVLQQESYVNYDVYQRVVSQLDENRAGSYVVYNELSQVDKEYKGVNFAYRIEGNQLKVEKDLLGSPIEYEYNQAGLVKRISQEQAGKLLFEKSYAYDHYGRQVSESLNRYQDGVAKKSVVQYDSLGRVGYVESDDVKQRIMQHAADRGSDQTRIVLTHIGTDNHYKSYTTEQKYSLAGNLMQSKDRNGYVYESRLDQYGNVKYSTQGVGGSVIKRSDNVYDESGLFLQQTELKSHTDANRQYRYFYDQERRLRRVENYALTGSSAGLITGKDYTYTEADRIKSVRLHLSGEAEDYVTGYTYNAAGQLASLTYPDGKVYVPQYDSVLKDGTLRGFGFDGQEIVSNIGYQHEGSGVQGANRILARYRSADEIVTGFEYDNAGRIVTKSFVDANHAGRGFSQQYDYDLAGNVTAIKEASSGSQALVKRLVQRSFEYDRYNRLLRAHYAGSFYREIKPRLSYLEQDYEPDQLHSSIKSLADQGHEKINLEQGANSVLISNAGLNEFKPDLIRVQKTAGSRFKGHHINLFYEKDNQYQLLTENTDYIVANKAGYFELEPLDLELSRLFKLNFEINDRDIDDEKQVTSGEAGRLKDQLRFFMTADSLEYEYSYDVLGNRLSRKQSLNKGGQSIDEQAETYVYDQEMRYLLEDGHFTYRYDIEGNLIEKQSKEQAGEKWSYTWTAAGQLSGVTQSDESGVLHEESYIYDESGQRVKAVTPDTSTVYIYEGLQLIYEIKVKEGQTTEKDLIYGLGQLQAVITTVDGNAGPAHFYHNDIQSTTRFIRDTNWVTQKEIITSPYGRPGVESESAGEKALHYQWATHEGLNEGTSLTYLKARWLDNNTGRFISSDPIQDGIYSWYNYCDGNPVSRIDPTGTFSVKELSNGDIYIQRSIGESFSIDISIDLSLPDSSNFNFSFNMPGLNGSGSSGGGNFGGLFSGSGLGMSFAAALLGLFTLNWNSPEEDEPGEEDIDTSTNDGGNPEKHARERWRQRHKNELAELKRRREEAYYEFVKKAPTKAQGYMDHLTKKLDSAIDIDMDVSFPETEKRNGWENALDTAKNIGKDVWNVASGREIFGDIQIGRHNLFTAMSKEDVNNMPFAENVVGNTIWALIATFYNTIGQAANIGGNLLQEAWNILEALEDWSYNTFGINSQDLNAALVAMGLPGISAFGSGIALFAQYSKFWLGHKFYKLMKLMSSFRAARKVSSKNIAQIEKHLSSINALDDPLNQAMLKKIKSGNITPNDMNFIQHELLESKLVKQGLSQIDAHNMALKQLNHSPFQIYNPEVVKAVDKILGVKTMNPGFYKFWGIK